MKIRELMTREPITLSPEEELSRHLDIFRKNRIHHIPVVNEGGSVVGMVSSRDFENMENLLKLLKPQEKPVTISDVMTSPIFAYFEDVSVHSAAQAMIDNNIHAIVVMDDREQMTGILTSTDLLKYLAGKQRD